jgi:hypothetical protein
MFLNHKNVQSNLLDYYLQSNRHFDFLILCLTAQLYLLHANKIASQDLRICQIRRHIAECQTHGRKYLSTPLPFSNTYGIFLTNNYSFLHFRLDSNTLPSSDQIHQI